MSGKEASGLLEDDVDEEQTNPKPPSLSNGEEGGDAFKSGDDGRDDKDYFQLPSHLASSQRFKGIAKNKKTGEVEVTVKLPSR